MGLHVDHNRSQAASNCAYARHAENAITALWLVGVHSNQDAIDTDQALHLVSCSCLKRQQTTGPDFLNVYLCQCGQFAGGETGCRHLLYVPLVGGISQNNAANQIPADRLLLPHKPDARVPPIVDLYGLHQSISAQLLKTRTTLEHILSNQIVFSKLFFLLLATSDKKVSISIE